MRMTHRNALEILGKGGAVPAGEWITGTGNFVNPRPVPQGCIKVYTKDLGTLHGISRDYAEKLLAARPKTRAMIVVDDHRLMEKLKEEAK